MLDISSEIIGSTALIAGNFLYSLFPFLPVSIAENPATIMVIVGFGGQLLFAMRFIIQWIKSEGERKSFKSSGDGSSIIVKFPIFFKEFFILGMCSIGVIHKIFMSCILRIT